MLSPYREVIGNEYLFRKIRKHLTHSDFISFTLTFNFIYPQSYQNLDWLIKNLQLPNYHLDYIIERADPQNHILLWTLYLLQGDQKKFYHSSAIGRLAENSLTWGRNKKKERYTNSQTC